MPTFGIWPGVVAADLVKLQPLDVPPEDPARTLAALRELVAPSTPFYVRAYRAFHDPGQEHLPDTPLRPELYLGEGRRLDLVAGFGSERGDVDGFVRHVRAAVRDVAARGGGKIQVCEEVNVPAPLDGGRPNAYQALAAGLAAALAERDRLGADVLVGFNASTPLPPDPFWTEVAAHARPEDLARVDYIGLDMFPDVFRPLPAPALPGAVDGLLGSFRTSATACGIPPEAPIHITETGWPTGPDHSETDQARVLQHVTETVLAKAAELNITAYELFGLRDGDTSGDRWTRFGLLRDDHTPKAAFHVMADLIRAHSPVVR